MIRIFRHYISKAYLGLVAVEFCLFFSAFGLGEGIRFANTEGSTIEDGVIFGVSLIFVTVMFVCLTGMGLYQRSSIGLRQRSSHWGNLSLLGRIAGSLFLGAVVMLLVFYLWPKLYVGRGVFAYAIGFTLVGVYLSRVIFYTVADRNLLKRRVLVLGTGNNAQKIIDLEGSGEADRFRVVGCVAIGKEATIVDKKRVIQLKNPLNEFVTDQDLDEIVVALDDRRQALPIDEILTCKMDGVEVTELMTFFEREAGLVRIDVIKQNASWLVFSDGFGAGALRLWIKRAVDVSVSLLLLVIIWPVMVITAIVVWIEGGGKASIFYKQYRVGLDLELFEVVKFRSMKPDAEKGGAQFAQKGDARITWVGRFIRKCRIDELPQLYNVLKGDMSFVGPRPERPEFVEAFFETIPYYAERHRVKPGLAGWAQLCYPYGAEAADAEKKLQYDLYYIKNYSLFFDLMIILQTTEIVLWGKGAR